MTNQLRIQSFYDHSTASQVAEVVSNMISGLKEWLLQLPDVVEAPHSFGGTEFQVNGRQFMHNHGPRYLDIHLSREDQERVLREGKAEPHRFTPAQAGWVTFHIRTDNDIETAKELITLAYNDARKITAFREQRVSSQ
jgi:luciferase-like monooxygenase